MEGGSFEIIVERSQDQLEIQKNPLEVFDSPKDAAEKQHKELMEQLLHTGEIHRSSRDSEISIETEGSSSAPSIQIAWPADSNTAMLLQLNPISEGKGLETGILGYSGTYGSAKKTKYGGQWELDPKKIQTLEQLFGVPDGLHLVVEPTITRWAIGKDRISAMLFGENARTLYMGLGFLLLGQQWMLIGFHEAGHLPNGNDENEAWNKANKAYAKIHKPRKSQIIKQEDLGLFELLKKPDWYNKKPTIGQITRYCLVSHYVGGTKIPERWKASAAKTMKEFEQVIEDAHEAYDNMLGR